MSIHDSGYVRAYRFEGVNKVHRSWAARWAMRRNIEKILRLTGVLAGALTKNGEREAPRFQQFAGVS
jgi:hypothetical protein